MLFHQFLRMYHNIISHQFQYGEVKRLHNQRDSNKKMPGCKNKLTLQHDDDLTALSNPEIIDKLQHDMRVCQADSHAYSNERQIIPLHN
jgi:hypothetical protein